MYKLLTMVLNHLYFILRAVILSHITGIHIKVFREILQDPCRIFRFS
jgi:hypothetical protein